jgi:hypothetical protein
MVATHALVKEYVNLFVNRRAYTVQSFRPHPQRGRHYYYRPTEPGSGAALQLNEKTISDHMEGKITIGLYAINPANQRCKWVAIDFRSGRSIPIRDYESCTSCSLTKAARSRHAGNASDSPGSRAPKTLRAEKFADWPSTAGFRHPLRAVRIPPGYESHGRSWFRPARRQRERTRVRALERHEERAWTALGEPGRGS